MEDVDKQELNRLITKVAKMTYREAQDYLKHFKQRTFKEKINPQPVKDVIFSKTDQTGEYIRININKPKFHAKRNKLELHFETDWEEQIYAIALRKCEKDIQNEIMNLINTEEFERYRKLALRKYKPNN